MPKDWLRRHPEKAREMGQKGGRWRPHFRLSADYIRGYRSGYAQAMRERKRRAA